MSSKQFHFVLFHLFLFFSFDFPIESKRYLLSSGIFVYHLMGLWTCNSSWSNVNKRLLFTVLFLFCSFRPYCYLCLEFFEMKCAWSCISLQVTCVRLTNYYYYWMSICLDWLASLKCQKPEMSAQLIHYSSNQKLIKTKTTKKPFN